MEYCYNTIMLNRYLTQQDVEDAKADAIDDRVTDYINTWSADELMDHLTSRVQDDVVTHLREIAAAELKAEADAHFDEPEYLL